jgi:hypothetical protein
MNVFTIDSFSGLVDQKIEFPYFTKEIRDLLRKQCSENSKPIQLTHGNDCESENFAISLLTLSHSLKIISNQKTNLKTIISFVKNKLEFVKCLREYCLFPIILQNVYKCDDHFETIFLIQLFLNDPNNVSFFDSTSIDICLKHLQLSFENFNNNTQKIEIIYSVLESLNPIFNVYERKADLDLIKLIVEFVINRDNIICLNISLILIQLFPTYLSYFNVSLVESIFIHKTNFKIIVDFISGNKIDEISLFGLFKIVLSRVGFSLESEQFLYCLASICNFIWIQENLIPIFIEDPQLKNILVKKLNKSISLQNSMISYLLSFYDEVENKDLIISHLLKWKKIDDKQIIAAQVEKRINYLENKINCHKYTKLI